MFTLSDIVPLGRSFDEYRRMFALSDMDLRRTILGCADGPASFNAEATQRGSQVVSCDPLYGFDGEQIQCQIDATFPEVMEQARKNATQFVWKDLASIEELERCRREAMRVFRADYEQGKRQRRMWRQNCRRCRSRMPRLIWPCARTFCSFTPIS